MVQRLAVATENSEKDWANHFRTKPMTTGAHMTSTSIKPVCSHCLAVKACLARQICTNVNVKNTAKKNAFTLPLPTYAISSPLEAATSSRYSCLGPKPAKYSRSYQRPARFLSGAPTGGRRSGESFQRPRRLIQSSAAENAHLASRRRRTAWHRSDGYCDIVPSTTHGIWLSLCPIPCHKNTAPGDAERYPNLPAQKSQKPAITRAPGHFLLDRAGQCRTPNHSHSIINKQVNIAKNGTYGETNRTRP